MPAEERVGDAVDAGRVGPAARHALDIAGLAVRLRDGAEEALTLDDLGASSYPPFGGQPRKAVTPATIKSTAQQATVKALERSRGIIRCTLCPRRIGSLRSNYSSRWTKFSESEKPPGSL